MAYSAGTQVSAAAAAGAAVCGVVKVRPGEKFSHALILMLFNSI